MKVLDEKRIDIWWRGQDRNGDLMLLLSYLIKLNSKWKKAVINIFSIADSKNDKLELEKFIKFSIKEARIDAKINVLIKESEDIVETLIKLSEKATIVFCGLSRDDNSPIENRILIMERITTSLNCTVFAQNNGMENDIPTIFSLTKN